MVDHMEKKTYDEIIYIDETTFNLWQRASKCWLRPGLRLPILQFRGHSITIIGAISQERGLVHYEIFDDHNNAERFGLFLNGLKNKCLDRKVAIVQDNLRIHHAESVKFIYNSKFVKMMLPTYSCQLNPIETFWSLLKRRWRQHMLLITEELALIHDNKNVQKRPLERLREIIGKCYSNSNLRSLNHF
jgi:transposase